MRIAFLGYLCVQEQPPALSSDFLTMLDEHDIRCVNLEGPIGMTSDPITKAGPHINSDDSVIDLIRAMKINQLCLSNNHFLDYGLDHALSTLSTLKVSAFGLNVANQFNSTTTVIDEFGQTISLIGVSESFDVTKFHSPTNGTSAVISIFDSSFDELLKLEINQKTFVVVVFHGGLEGTKIPLPEWRQVFRDLISKGVCAVIAHHPHVVQPRESFEGGSIYYSLGNLCMAPNRQAKLESSIGLCVSMQTFEHGQVNFTESIIQYDPIGNQVNLLDKSLDEVAPPINEDNYLELVERLCVERYKSDFGPFFEDVFNAVGHTPSWRKVFSLLKQPLLHKYVRGHPEILRSRQVALEHLFRVESNRWTILRALSSNSDLLN